MKVNASELYSKLKSKKIFYLYHADTITTSLNCLYNGGLFSRGEMESRKLRITKQKSDVSDKKFNVWNDIFLDTVDLHGYKYSKSIRQNFYGPVLFILKIDLLLDPCLDNIWITTNNPSKWNKDSKEVERYFDTVDSYIDNMDTDRQRKMITIRDMNESILFSKYLKEIKLDDPNIVSSKSGKSVYEYAFNKLKIAINYAKLEVNITKHICDRDCYCIRNYYEMDENEFWNLFVDYNNVSDYSKNNML